MVAIIKSGYSIHRMLNYNEHKVKEGVAVCIGAGNYTHDPDLMDVRMKLNGFLNRMELNQRSKRNSVHISLNFDPSENGFSKEKLMEIAEVYMGKIGFGAQPFLVYQHHDAGHPHIHIVTTNIQMDGKAIDMHLIGKRKSEPARKSIEKSFGLVRAEDQKKLAYRPDPVSARVIEYGKSQTKKAIQNVLEHVLNSYSYTSLHELNALLGLYRVRAYTGEEGSRIQRHRGLLYRVLDEQGNPIGVPIKASLFYNRPTLDRLQELFENNGEKKSTHRTRVRNAVDRALLHRRVPLTELRNVLQKQGIDMVLRQNAGGLVYGVTYVDHVSRCVFNGSALGKPYSAKALQERCMGKGISGQDSSAHPAPEGERRLQPRGNAAAETGSFHIDPELVEKFPEVFKIIEDLFGYTYSSDYMPYELTGKKRKKRRRKKRIND